MSEESKKDIIGTESLITDLIYGKGTKEAVESFNMDHIAGDLGLLVAITAIDDPDVPAEVKDRIPPMMMMLGMIMKMENADIEKMAMSALAKHLVMRDLRNGDEGLHGAYAELEYAAQQIKKELQKQ